MISLRRRPMRSVSRGHRARLPASLRTVLVSTLRAYRHGRIARPGLAFGYGAIDERSIVEGLTRLRRLIGR